MEEEEFWSRVVGGVRLLKMEDRELLEELCAIEEGLTEWEVEFVENMAQVLDRYSHLTPAQRIKAEEILEDKG